MRWSAPSRSSVEALLAVAVLLGSGLWILGSPTAAGSAPPLPILSTGRVENITLYGDALRGWGYAANNATRPGPHLYVGYGDQVQLTLISADGAIHNWFIDHDNSSQPSSAWPSSPTFGPGDSKIWPFNATQLGTFSYRCKFHPSSMFGLITISAPTHYTLYGDALRGWGFDPKNITKPGPTLVIEAGVNVTLTLHAVDGAAHTWFIDYDNSTSVNAGEKESPQFGGPGNPNPLDFPLRVSRGGLFAYRCGIHLTTMWGMIVVIGGSSGGPTGLGIGLVPGIMFAVIVGVLVLAGAYQVRAVRAHRLRK